MFNGYPPEKHCFMRQAILWGKAREKIISSNSRLHGFTQYSLVSLIFHTIHPHNYLKFTTKSIYPAKPKQFLWASYKTQVNPRIEWKDDRGNIILIKYWN